MQFIRKYGVAFKIRLPVVKAGVSDFAVGADWTPAAGDVKISKDGGAAANITTLPSAIAMGNGAVWEFAVSATEAQAAEITITVVDSATKAVQDQALSVITFGNASAGLQIDWSDAVRSGLTALPNAAAEASGGLPTLSAAQASNGTINANVHRWLTGTPNALQSGRVDSYLGAVAAGVIAAASFAASALDAVWSTATRVLTAGTNIALAKGTGVTGFTDLDAAGVRSAVGLASANLDTQLAALDSDIVSRAAPGDAMTLTAAYAAAKTAAQASDIPSASTIAQAVWDALTSALTTVGSVGKLLVDNIDAAISTRSTYAGGDTSGTTTLLSRLTSTRAGLLDNLDATVSTRLATSGYTAPDNAGIAAVKAKTDNLPDDPADESLIIAATDALSTAIAALPSATDNADALLTRDMSAVTEGDGRTPIQALRALRNKVAISGSTMTVNKEDDATASWTAQVTTDAAANPITAIDPA